MTAWTTATETQLGVGSRALNPLSACIAALRAAFRRELRNNCVELTRLLLAADQLAPSSAQYARLLQLTHSIAGRAGTFGLAQLSVASLLVHDRLEAQAADLREAAGELLIAIVSDLLGVQPAGGDS